MGLEARRDWLAGWLASREGKVDMLMERLVTWRFVFERICSAGVIVASEKKDRLPVESKR